MECCISKCFVGMLCRYIGCCCIVFFVSILIYCCSNGWFWVWWWFLVCLKVKMSEDGGGFRISEEDGVREIGGIEGEGDDDRSDIGWWFFFY